MILYESQNLQKLLCTQYMTMKLFPSMQHYLISVIELWTNELMLLILCCYLCVLQRTGAAPLILQGGQVVQAPITIQNLQNLQAAQQMAAAATAVQVRCTVIWPR